MNYQVVPFWFYSGKVLLAVLAAIGLGLCGVNAAIFYCLLLGVVWPVAVSIGLAVRGALMAVGIDARSDVSIHDAVEHELGELTQEV